MAMSVANVVQDGGFYTADVIASADADTELCVAHGCIIGDSIGAAAHGGGGAAGGQPPRFVTYAPQQARGVTGLWEVAVRGSLLYIRKNSTAAGSGDANTQIRVFVSNFVPPGLVDAVKKGALASGETR